MMLTQRPKHSILGPTIFYSNHLRKRKSRPGQMLPNGKSVSTLNYAMLTSELPKRLILLPPCRINSYPNNVPDCLTSFPLRPYTALQAEPVVTTMISSLSTDILFGSSLQMYLDTELERPF